MKKVFAVLAVLFAVFVLAVIFGGGDDSKSSLSDNSQAQAKPESIEPPVVVAAKDLVKDYESNEVAADQKYKGKILEVSGKVAGIDSGIGDAANVRLVGTNDFNSALASGDDEFTKYAATLSKGVNITLICLSDGEVLGSPSLKECKPKQ